MEMEDDAVLIIVVGEPDLSSRPAVIQDKEKNSVEVDGGLPKECDEQDKQFEVCIIKEEVEDMSIKDESETMNASEGGCDYLTDIRDLSSNENFDDGIKSPLKRTRMVRSHERHSYVQSIKNNYPELENDNELLIDILVSLMKATKAPPPPLDYYVMNDIMLECVICAHQSESIPAASRHYQEKHGSRYLFCLACGVNFRTTTNLYKHEKRCDAPDATVVLKARAIFLGRKGRSRPFLRKRYPVKKSKRFNCSECSATFMSKVSLVAHQHMHSGVRPYVCPICLRAYTSSTALSRHVKKHGDERYICDHCQKSFNVKAALATHMNTHRPLKRFGCAECDKRYSQRSALNLHVDREHRGLPPPCACKLCPKRYPRMSVLKQHMKEVHGMMLMTRKMFFKSLPTLSNTPLQCAKLVMKSDVQNDFISYSVK